MSNGKVFGTTQLSDLIEAAVKYSKTDSDCQKTTFRSAIVVALMQTAGTKVHDKRWEASGENLYRLIEDNTYVTEDDGSHAVELIIGDNKPIFSIYSKKSHSDKFVNYILARLANDLVGDTGSKKTYKSIESEFDKKREAESDKLMAEKRAEIPKKNTNELRKELKLLAQLSEIDSRIFWDAQLLDRTFSLVKEEITGRGRSSNLQSRFGRFAECFMRNHDIPWEMEDALISETGVIIGSFHTKIFLCHLDEYKRSIDKSPETTTSMRQKIAWKLSTKHVDMMRGLLRCHYENPRYLAPIEDLLDHIALEFYAGKRAGNAEDCAVGALVDLWRKEVNGRHSLQDLGEHLKYWTEERLSSCLDLWELHKDLLTD